MRRSVFFKYSVFPSVRDRVVQPSRGTTLPPIWDGYRNGGRHHRSSRTCLRNHITWVSHQFYFTVSMLLVSGNLRQRSKRRDSTSWEDEAANQTRMHEPRQPNETWTWTHPHGRGAHTNHSLAQFNSLPISNAALSCATHPHKQGAFMPCHALFSVFRFSLAPTHRTKCLFPSTNTPPTIRINLVTNIFTLTQNQLQ